MHVAITPLCPFPWKWAHVPNLQNPFLLWEDLLSPASAIPLPSRVFPQPLITAPNALFWIGSCASSALRAVSGELTTHTSGAEIASEPQESCD